MLDYKSSIAWDSFARFAILRNKILDFISNFGNIRIMLDYKSSIAWDSFARFAIL